MTPSPDPKGKKRRQAPYTLDIGAIRPSYPKGVMITITHVQGHALFERPKKLYTRNGGIMPPPSLFCKKSDMLPVFNI